MRIDRPALVFYIVLASVLVLLIANIAVNRSVGQAGADAAIEAHTAARDATVAAFDARGDTWRLTLEAEYAEDDRDACWAAIELLTLRLHYMSYRTPDWRQRVPWITPDPERPVRTWDWGSPGDLRNWRWPNGVKIGPKWRWDQ